MSVFDNMIMNLGTYMYVRINDINAVPDHTKTLISNHPVHGCSILN